MSLGKIKNISYTSIMSYKSLVKSGQDVSEKNKVLSFLLESKPQTSRYLSNKLGIERTNITRVLSELEQNNIVEISFIGICPTTKRSVKHYGLVEEYKCP